MSNVKISMVSHKFTAFDVSTTFDSVTCRSVSQNFLLKYPRKTIGRRKCSFVFQLVLKLFAWIWLNNQRRSSPRSVPLPTLFLLNFYYSFSTTFNVIHSYNVQLSRPPSDLKLGTNCRTMCTNLEKSWSGEQKSCLF